MTEEGRWDHIQNGTLPKSEQEKMYWQIKNLSFNLRELSRSVGYIQEWMKTSDREDDPDIQSVTIGTDVAKWITEYADNLRSELNHVSISNDEREKLRHLRESVGHIQEWISRGHVAQDKDLVAEVWRTDVCYWITGYADGLHARLKECEKAKKAR